MKKLLITGASGLIGDCLVRASSCFYEICGTYCNRVIHSNTIRTFRMFLEDPINIKAVINTIRPDVIIHTAAWTNIHSCEENPQKAFLINSEATKIIAETANHLGARLIYLSTDMVFDGEKGNYSEADLPNPINVYGKSKYLGELSVEKYCKNYVIARIALVYGESHSQSNSASVWILNALRNRQNVHLFTNEYRTPVWTEDLADAVLELCDHEFCGILHLGSKLRVSRYRFGIELAQRYNLPQKYIHRAKSSDQSIRPKDASFSISLARNVLKTTLHDYRQGIGRMILKNN